MSRLYAFSDIHGAISKFEKALKDSGLVNSKLNWMGGDSKLVSLGDVIDRGPDSRGVIDLILKLKRQAKKVGGEVITLMGNHETMLIDSISLLGWRQCWLENGGLTCLENYDDILERDSDGNLDYWSAENPKRIYEHHKEYFENLLPFAIIDGIMFVHAGVDPAGDLESLTKGLQVCNNGKTHLWIREQFYGHYSDDFIEKYKVKKIVFGHTPAIYLTGNKKDIMSPVEKLYGKLLGIDCGSNYLLGQVCIVEFDKDGNWKIAGSSQ